MLRFLIDDALLFLAPFALFALWLAVTRRNPMTISHWSGRLFALTLAGLLFGIASVLWAGMSSDVQRGSYTPARVENGQLVPGRLQD